MNEYVPAGLLQKKLQDAGFKPVVVGNEVAYQREHDRASDLIVRVYTTIDSTTGEVRACGEDAIRVCLLWKDKNGKIVGITRTSRVYRVGSAEDIVSRMLSRARMMWKKANRMQRIPRCMSCGAPQHYDTFRGVTKLACTAWFQCQSRQRTSAAS